MFQMYFHIYISCTVFTLILCFSPDLSEALLPMQPSDVLDMPVDPNEPTYCLCHQVSYGEMIGCDNPDVSLNFYFCFIQEASLQVQVEITGNIFTFSVQSSGFTLLVLTSPLNQRENGKTLLTPECNYLEKKQLLSIK